MSLSLPILTNSALSTARACLRLYRNRYVLQLRALKEPADNAELGNLVHKGLEVWWLTGVILRALELMREHARANETDAFQLARAEALLIAYDARWLDDRERYEVLGAELEFSAPLVNPETGAASKTFRIAGKLDVVVRERATRRVLIIEHKTSSEDVSPGSIYWLRLQMDGQVSIYFDGAAALGHDVQGCLYDVLGKPALRPSAVPLVDDQGVKIVHDQGGQRVRTKDGKKWRETGDTAQGYVLQTRPETPDEFRARLLDALTGDPEKYFQRGEVARTSTDLEEAARDRWQMGTLLRDATRTSTWPRNPDACTRFGSVCEYLEACGGRADLNDPYLFRKAQSAHPELPGIAAEPTQGAA